MSKKAISMSNNISESGVYYIKNLITNQLYIGQSKNLSKRRQSHISQLRQGNHNNGYLQNSFDEYGEEYFEFGVITYCNPVDLTQLEKYYINKYNHNNTLFNIMGGENSFKNNSSEKTTMQIHKSTLDALDQVGERGQTYEYIIRMLLHAYDESITFDNYK